MQIDFGEWLDAPDKYGYWWMIGFVEVYGEYNGPIKMHVEGWFWIPDWGNAFSVRDCIDAKYLYLGPLAAAAEAAGVEVTP